MPLAGHAIRTAREQAGLTQAQLAERLGWHPANVSAYERDERSPSVEVLGRIAGALKRSVIVTAGRVVFVAPKSVRLPREA